MNVYSYDSFTSEWERVKVKQDFEKRTHNALLISRLLKVAVCYSTVFVWKEKKTKADIVLGLDNFVLEQAEKTGIFHAK